MIIGTIKRERKFKIYMKMSLWTKNKKKKPLTRLTYHQYCYPIGWDKEKIVTMLLHAYHFIFFFIYC